MPVQQNIYKPCFTNNTMKKRVEGDGLKKLFVVLIVITTLSLIVSLVSLNVLYSINKKNSGLEGSLFSTGEEDCIKDLCDTIDECEEEARDWALECLKGATYKAYSEEDDEMREFYYPGRRDDCLSEGQDILDDCVDDIRICMEDCDEMFPDNDPVDDDDCLDDNCYPQYDYYRFYA